MNKNKKQHSKLPLDDFTKGYVLGTLSVGLANTIMVLLGYVHYTFL